MLPMIKTTDNGVNQVPEFKTSETSSEEPTNVESDMNGGEHVYRMSEVDENEIEENVKDTNERSYTTENDDATEEGVDAEKFTTPINLDKFPEEEGWQNFENYFDNKNSDSGDQFPNESDDGTLDAEYKNQPDLVQSCWKFSDDSGKRSRRRE
jgi:hypothetical protein